LYDVFWWCSAMARMDTRDTRSDLRERYPSRGMTFTRPMLPPEEATTFNLVRRLATQQRLHGGVGVVSLHSKALEGGLAGRRPPSGADIELAVEVTPGNWIDLLLQAKRIYEPHRGSNGSYKGWKDGQVRALRRWAARNGDRTPGVLLYNAQVPPFVAPGHYVALRGCGMSPIQCHGWRWPKWNPPDRRSPTAVTLLILPAYGSRMPRSLSRDSISANIVNRYASPLECIFCPGRLTETNETCGGKTGYPICAIKPKNQIPQWAATLLATVEDQAEGEEAQLISGVRPSPDDDRWNAQYSIVLPYIG
jgi:hypothetical protein